MVHRPAAKSRHARAFCLSLSPLVTALAATLPLHSQAQAVKVPMPSAVPVPSASWRVNGTGGTAPVNRPNTAGGVDQTISQTSARAIYQWNSFDIGDKSSVTFDMARQGASALNRIGGTAPSQIFGKLSATNGGEIFLINANGILFGKGAQVNTGSLVASALNIADSEYLSGFAQSLANPGNAALNAAFRYGGTAEDFVDAKSFVRVDEGAAITTANGGRVFLFAKRVENAGSIITPGGQAVLAGGGEVYLKLPSSETKLYASETNPNIAVLRGFLVEVGAGPADGPEGPAGSASNLKGGVISTPRGNTTLVGMAVNQLGRISATTSVSENGSIILRAQGAAATDFNVIPNSVRATASGALTLGEGSLTTITPDTTLDGKGQPLTTTDTVGFATSHLDLAGQSITFGDGAAIVAPGATVNLRAESVPSYAASLAIGGESSLAAGDPAARIVLGAGALIDVSGSTDAVASVARHFVTTELLGSNDLKDAPEQKNGLLSRAKVTLDTREDSLILGSLDKYRDGIARTVDERLSTGGSVNLRAEGAVLTRETSRIDVSGGQVRYTEAQVKTTELLASDGKRYNLNDAPTDGVFVSATNLQKSSLASYDRWGVQLAFGTVTPGRLEAGYVEGRSAGGISMAAPNLLLQGGLDARASNGERQTAGQDPLAVAGRLSLGAVVNAGFDFGNAAYEDAVLKNFNVSTAGPVSDPSLWLAPLAGELPESSGMAASTLQAAGFGEVAIAANGAVAFDAGSAAPYQLGDSGSLRLLSLDDDVHLASDLRGAHGKVELTSKQRSRDPVTGLVKSSGEVRVADGVRVDLSGAWVNAAVAALPLDTSATAGGTFNAAGYGVTLGTGSVIDVSGGASASASGVVAGAAAGAITLRDFTLAQDADHNTLLLGGELRGHSAQTLAGVSTGGGALSLQTHTVNVSNVQTPPGAPRAGAVAGPGSEDVGLTLTSAFFDQGGFGSFSIDGRLALTVAANTVIAPQRQTLQVPLALPAVLLPASGTPASEVLQQGPAAGVRAGPVNLTLASSGDSVLLDQGALSVGEGSVLAPGAQGAVKLTAAHRLVFEGRIESHGGDVSLSLTRPDIASPNLLWLGAGSEIDVSGTTLLTPGVTDGTLQGKVLAGGRISVDAAVPTGSALAAGSLVLQQGARLDASGASGELDVTERSDAGLRTTRRTVASEGGQVSLAGNGDLLLEGKVNLQGGGPGAAGGKLSVTLRDAVTDLTAPRRDARELVLTPATGSATVGLTADALAAPGGIAGRAEVSSTWLQASGASDVSLASSGTLRMAGDVQLDVARNLTLAARGFGADAGSRSSLSGSTVFMGWNAADVGGVESEKQPLPPPASAGDAELRVAARSGLVVDGNLVTQGLGSLALHSDGDMRLQSREPLAAGGYSGSLTTPAALSLSAAQIYPATDTRFTIDAGGSTVAIAAAAGAGNPARPLSAGGSLIVNASRIEQAGVLRAPLGHIELRAREALILAAGSETSVSAAGASLPYGTATATTWTRPGGGALLTAPPDKQIVLDAPQVTTQAGSVIDASGGGQLVATEFVPGAGGSSNILAGGDGSYAVVPSITGLAPHDASLAGGAAPAGRQIEISTALKLPDGTLLAAGRYTLLPARYALLPGAVLVRPASGGTPLALGTVVPDTDGSVLIGARLRDAGTGFGEAFASTWQVMDKITLLRYSEIREYDAGPVFAARAAKAGTAAAPLPNDAGSLVVRALQAQLEGQGLFSAAADAKGQALGQGGRAEFVADSIQVDAGTVAGGDGVLHLSVATLNQLGAQTVVLGASSTATGSADAADAASGAAPEPRSLRTEARSVVFAQGEQALTVPDLLASASGSILVGDNAVFAPAAGTVLSSTPAAYTVRGDGAALRIALAPGASLTRNAVGGESGSLRVGLAAQINAAAGSVVLDSTGSTSIAGNAQLSASDITLAGSRVVVGSPLPSQNTLALTPTLLAQVGAADSLTLRGYERIGIIDGTVLGDPALSALVLDTPRLIAMAPAGGEAPAPAGAQVVAGDLTLTNTTGARDLGVLVGSSPLSLQASSAAGGSGQLHIAGGAIAFGNITDLTLAADTAVTMSGRSTLRAPGSVTISSPALVAAQAAAEMNLSAGDVFRLESAAGSAAPVSAAGSVFEASARAIELAGRIVLPSGRISLAGGEGVQLLQGGVADVAGRSVKLDTQTVDLSGGSISLSSATGDVGVQTGASIDVSGAGSSGLGGFLSLSAAQGGVILGGELRGSAGAAAARRASLEVDTGSALNVARVGLLTSAGNFGETLELRQREGDLVVGSLASLKAREIDISVDGGALRMQGSLDTSGSNGGRIALVARDDLTLTPTSRLLANATQAGGDGGRVALSSAQGELRLAAGSVIDLRGGAAPTDGGSSEGGRLTLRALQTGSADVAIGPLAGSIVGASRIDVQAVKVYEGVTRIDDFETGDGVLATWQVASDAAAFIGPQGSGANAIALRLAGGNTAVADRLKVHAEAEVRAPGDLTLPSEGDWILPKESIELPSFDGTPTHAGDTSLTLRAAGNLLIKQGLESGFDFAGAASDAGGNIRLVAGADLGAASAMATGTLARDLVVARGQPARGRPSDIAVRTTTGHIELAASGDMALDADRNSVLVYSSGRVADAAAQTAADNLGFGYFQGEAFSTGGGDVSLQAGGEVRGNERLANRDVAGGSVVNVKGQTGPISAEVTTGWASYGRGLRTGVAAIGGGDLTVQAGRDVIDLVAVAPSSGYYTTAVADGALDVPVVGESVLRRFDGGNVTVQAGRDVVNGLFAAGGQALTVTAGRDLARREEGAGEPTPGTRLYHENTRITADARRNLRVGGAQSAFLSDTWLTGLDGDASLSAVATAGFLDVTARDMTDQAFGILLPASTRLAAPSGDLSIGDSSESVGLLQLPVTDSSLVALAGGDLSLGSTLYANATRSTLQNSPGYFDALALNDLRLSNTPVFTDGSSSLDQSQRQPVHLVAATGDLTVRGELASARPVRLVAGRDIVLSNDAVVRAQHQAGADGEAVRELSLLQAGRDIQFGNGIVRVAGGGDAVLLAGRDIDLGRANSFTDGSGLMAIGNTENGLLPSQSAALTVVASLRADGVDYSTAVKQGFHALGAAALAERAGDVYALLASTDASVPALGSTAAVQFDALDTNGQLAQIKALLGDAAYNLALATYVRGLQGNAALSNDQALAAFDSQSPARRDAAPGSLLASQLAGEAAEQRVAFVTQVASKDTPRTALALQAWMQAKTGQSLSLADAVSAFEALPVERQVSWLNQVLVDEVRTQGRAAAQTSGFEAEAAYLRGYQAINTVFAIDRPGGEIRLPTTQIKTLQSANTTLLAATEKQRAVTLGAVTLMAPGGGVNAGELGSTAQSPNNLGLVTVAGGDIAGIVRDDFLVNQSRVFSLAEGDILLWASAGDIDAGKGAKTVTGAPAPVLRLDPNSGKLVLDTSGSFTGSGIAVLNAGSDLDLYAPAGAIDAGEAGIRAQGNVFLGAQVVRGADNLQFGGTVVGAPVATATVSASAGLASAASALSQAGNATDDEEERRKRRLARRNLLLEFLGFGRG